MRGLLSSDKRDFIGSRTLEALVKLKAEKKLHLDLLDRKINDYLKVGSTNATTLDRSMIRRTCCTPEGTPPWNHRSTHSRWVRFLTSKLSRWPRPKRPEVVVSVERGASPHGVMPIITTRYVAKTLTPTATATEPITFNQERRFDALSPLKAI